MLDKITRPPAFALEPNACAADVSEDLEYRSLNDPVTRERAIAVLSIEQVNKLEAGEDIGIRCGVLEGDEVCGVEAELSYNDRVNGEYMIQVVDSSALYDCPKQIT